MLSHETNNNNFVMHVYLLDAEQSLIVARKCANYMKFTYGLEVGRAVPHPASLVGA